MSDVFNTKANKTKILTAIGVKTEENVTDNLIVEAFIKPRELSIEPQPAPSLIEVANYVLEKGIKCYKPHFLKEIQLVEMEDVVAGSTLYELEQFNAQLRLIEEELYKNQKDAAKEFFITPESKVYLPVGPLKLMSYKPLYKNRPPDTSILNEVVYYFAEKDIYNNLINEMKLLINAGQSTVLSSGTWQGQLTRLSDMTKIRNGQKPFFKPLPMKECGITLEHG